MIYQDHPLSPNITQYHPISPYITLDHPLEALSPLITLNHLRSQSPYLGEEGKKTPPPWPVILATTKPQISWGGGVHMMEPSNVYIEKVKKLDEP